MSKVEVLVATMNQIDFSLIEKMNIQTDAIICNQCDKNEFIETEINGCRVRMLSTTTRGVGINRNLAMQLSEAEICLCADDDVVYVDDYERIVLNEFSTIRKADIIGFKFISQNLERPSRNFSKTKKTNKTFGGCSIAYINTKIQQTRLNFSRLFGGGARYGSGEDSLFCKDALKNKLKSYSTNKLLGTVKQEESTWFFGYTEKFFFDNGAWCKAAYPKTWRLRKYYLILKQKKLSEFSYLRVIKLMNQGAKAYKKSLSYDEFMTWKET